MLQINVGGLSFGMALCTFDPAVNTNTTTTWQHGATEVTTG